MPIRVHENTIHTDFIEPFKKEAIAINNKMVQYGVLKDNKYITFWLGKEDEPKSLIEYIARNISFQDFPNGFPDNYVGLEWWVQVRNTKEGIVFHYDKDEGTCSQKDIYIYPLKSTITYLTDVGGPTGIFNDESYNNGYLSFPKVNKHVVFDGHLFHGVIGSLGKMVPNDDQKRITFLINYWHQKPIEPNCVYFPHDKIKLSPVTDEQKELQSSIQKEKSKIIKMNYQSGVNNIFIERLQKNNQGDYYQKKIPLKIAKKLKEKTTYSFRFNTEVVMYHSTFKY